MQNQFSIKLGNVIENIFKKKPFSQFQCVFFQLKDSPNPNKSHK